jgi:Cof subfamily protein (haloacid dehalogenase superfamily)
MLPRLIATDLDGTLLDARGAISARNVAALQAAAAAGITVVFASGRPPHIVGELCAAVGPAVTHGVLANGTLVCTLPACELLTMVGFPTEVAIDAIQQLRAADPLFGFALATDRGFTAEPGFFERMPAHPKDPPVDDVLAHHDGSTEAVKLLVFHHVKGAMELLDSIPAVLGGALGVTHMGAEAVELGPPGLDKGAGLSWLCDHLGIDPAEILVFGDEVNDLSMFAMAGFSVAMENGAPEVRAAADEIAPRNVVDGVAVVIERILADGGI